MTSQQQDYRTAPSSSTTRPGIVHVAGRACGAAPVWHTRLRQQQNPPPQRRPIVTMREVRKYLPVVEGELIIDAAAEGEHESSSSVKLHELVREDTERTAEISERSVDSIITSSVDISESSAKDFILGPAKAFFQGGFAKLSKNKKNNAKQQRPPSKNRRKLLGEQLLAQPSMLLPPGMAKSISRAPPSMTREEVEENSISSSKKISNNNEAKKKNTNNKAKNRRPSLERKRNTRRLPSSESFIPEEGINHGAEERDIAFIAPTYTTLLEEEVIPEDAVVDHIADLFPDADPRLTHQWVREGRSVRNIVGQLCQARRSSLRASLILKQSTHDQPEEMQSLNQSLDAQDVIADEDAEITAMVIQIQEAFPDVDMNQSYAMLRYKSLHEVMSELAEKSLNCAAGDLLGVRDEGHVDESLLQHAHDAFPYMQRAELKYLLRERSLSGVMIRLLNEMPAEEVQLADLSTLESGED